MPVLSSAFAFEYKKRSRAQNLTHSRLMHLALPFIETTLLSLAQSHKPGPSLQMNHILQTLKTKRLGVTVTSFAKLFEQRPPPDRSRSKPETHRIQKCLSLTCSETSRSRREMVTRSHGPRVSRGCPTRQTHGWVCLCVCVCARVFFFIFNIFFCVFVGLEHVFLGPVPLSR